MGLAAMDGKEDIRKAGEHHMAERKWNIKGVRNSKENTKVRGGRRFLAMEQRFLIGTIAQGGLMLRLRGGKGNSREKPESLDRDTTPCCLLPQLKVHSMSGGHMAGEERSME